MDVEPTRKSLSARRIACRGMRPVTDESHSVLRKKVNLTCMRQALSIQIYIHLILFIVYIAVIFIESLTWVKMTRCSISKQVTVDEHLHDLAICLFHCRLQLRSCLQTNHPACYGQPSMKCTCSLNSIYIYRLYFIEL